MIESIRKSLASIADILRLATPSDAPRLTFTDLEQIGRTMATVNRSTYPAVAERLTNTAARTAHMLANSRTLVLGRCPGTQQQEHEMKQFLLIAKDFNVWQSRVVVILFTEAAFNEDRTRIREMINAGFDVNAKMPGNHEYALDHILAISKALNGAIKTTKAVTALLDCGARVTKSMLTQDVAPEIHQLLEAAYLRQAAREGRVFSSSKIARSPL